MLLGLPNTDQLSQLISQATAPAFLLGAVAGFISILITRMTAILDRIRSLNEIGEHDDARTQLKSDIPRLKRRASLLNRAIFLALASGISATFLLILGFVCALLGFRHEYGAALLFLVSVGLLGASLFRFARGIGLSEIDHYR
jgi:hypothetical protein